MVNAGVFDDVDAAIMFHPGTETAVTLDRSLAARGFEFYFHGRAAHAAGAPEEGINALDAVVLMYNAISVLRQQVRSDVRIHGIILSGGAAANIIPDYAAIRYRTRADDSEYLEEIVQRVVACAEGAARATGCTLEWKEYMPGYENTMPNKVLLELMTAEPALDRRDGATTSGGAAAAARRTSATSRGACRASRRASPSPTCSRHLGTRSSSARPPAPTRAVRRCWSPPRAWR